MQLGTTAVINMFNGNEFISGNKYINYDKCWLCNVLNLD